MFLIGIATYSFNMKIQKGLVEQYRTSSNLEARIRLHEQFSANKQRWPLWVFDQLALSSSARVLDLGCGVGKLWHDNLHRVPQDWSVILSDFSRGMIEKARASLAHYGSDFHFTVSDAQHIPFGDESFDAVVANHMLYHVPDLAQTLAEIRRVLKPAGTLYAATNGVNHLRELDDLTPADMPHEPAGEVISGFMLENGRASLEQFFADVELRRHEDFLLVTESAPLADYMLSMSTFANLQVEGGKKQAILAHIQAEMINRGGTIRITKDSGLFIASK